MKHDGKTVDAVALASKNGFLYVFDRVTGKPLWPIEERPVPASQVPGEVTSKTQPFPTVVPPFARQGVTVKDMYDRVHEAGGEGLVDRPSDESANRFLYPAGGRGGYAGSSGSERRPIVLRHRADRTNGTVYVLSKDMPSILKLMPAGESTAANSGGMIPSHPRNSALQGRPGVPTTEQLGRALYEQRCQMCHGPELKGIVGLKSTPR